MSGPINFNNIDLNEITFTVGPKKANRSPPIYLKYKGANFQVLLPKLVFPAGCLVRTDKESGNKNYTLLGSLKTADPFGKERYQGTDESGKLYNFLRDLEEKVQRWAIDNSVAAFGKKRSEETIRESFKPIVSLSCDKTADGEKVPNGKYPPSFTVKVPIYENQVKVDVIDANRDPVYVTPETLESKDTPFPKVVEAKIVMSCSIYVIGGTNWGLTWRLTNAQVFPPKRATSSAIFADDEDEEETEETENKGYDVDDSTPVPSQSQPVEEEVPSTPVQSVEEKTVPAGPVRKRRTAA